jgi:hypothetical protein
VFERISAGGTGTCPKEIATEIGSLVTGPVAVTLEPSCGLAARAAVHAWRAAEGGVDDPLATLGGWLAPIDVPKMLVVPRELRARLGLQVALAIPIQTIWKFGTFVVSFENVTKSRVRELRDLAARLALRLDEADRQARHGLAPANV